MNYEILSIMKILSKRNLFFSIFELVYSLIITMLAQVIFIFLCMMPMNITLAQFEQSIFWKVVFSIFSAITYFIVSKIVGRQLFELRDTIWIRYRKNVSYIICYSVLTIIWLILTDVFLSALLKTPLIDDAVTLYTVGGIAYILTCIGVYFVLKIILQKIEYLDLEELANKDEMTGVLNRRGGLSYLQKVLKIKEKQTVT